MPNPFEHSAAMTRQHCAFGRKQKIRLRGLDGDVGYAHKTTVSQQTLHKRPTPQRYTLQRERCINQEARVRVGEVALRSGDEVQIGKFRLVYMVAPSGRS